MLIEYIAIMVESIQVLSSQHIHLFGQEQCRMKLAHFPTDLNYIYHTLYVLKSYLTST